MMALLLFQIMIIFLKLQIKRSITFFGTGAKYIDYLKQKKIIIKDKFKLSKLKTLASTGSPLSPRVI